MAKTLRLLSLSELDLVAGGDGPPTSSNYNVVNSDGSPVTQGQLDNLDRALTYLSQSPTALASLTAFEGNTIELRTDDNDYTSSDGHTVGWDPNSALVTNEGGVQSSALGLAHEIGGHAESQNGLDLNNPSPETGYPNQAEYTATKYEDTVASELGEPQRTDYGDVDRTMLVADTDAHGDYNTGAANGQWDIPGETSFYDFDSLNDYYGGSDYGDTYSGEGDAWGGGDYEDGGFFSNEAMSY